MKDKQLAGDGIVIVKVKPGELGPGAGDAIHSPVLAELATLEEAWELCEHEAQQGSKYRT